LYITKLKEEIVILNKGNENMKKDNDNLKMKLAYYEQAINDNVFEYREKIEKYEQKIFVQENEIIKHNVTITHLKRKLDKIFDRREQQNFEDRETLVICYY
jgi:predicted RNase H-like nuclease (RuvC/YqgF family)